MLSKEQEEDPCQAAELSPIGFSCLSTQKKKKTTRTFQTYTEEGNVVAD